MPKVRSLLSGTTVLGTAHTLPTHQQAEKAVIAGVSTPIDRFIALYEIDGPDDKIWRQSLAGVIKQAYQLGWNDREGDLLAGVDRVMGKQ